MSKTKRVIEDIIEYEMGSLSDYDTLKLFKRLIESNLIAQLQGHYGRTAKALIDNGFLIVNEDNSITINKEAL